MDRSISATLGDAREVNMCVHARFDSYVKAYCFAQTPSPKCTLLLSRNTFLLNLYMFMVRVSVSKYNTVGISPRPWWMSWLIAPRCTVVILPPPYKPPSSTSQPHSTSSPSLSPVCWSMWALGQGSSAYVLLFMRGTAYFQVLATSGCKRENRAIQSSCRRIWILLYDWLTQLTLL